MARLCLALAVAVVGPQPTAVGESPKEMLFLTHAGLYKHVHTYQEQPFCAQLRDGMYRTPSVTSTVFGDVSLFWYMNQADTPAASTRRHLMDHIGLSVADPTREAIELIEVK